MFTQLGCKNTGIMNFEFVAKTQFLYWKLETPRFEWNIEVISSYLPFNLKESKKETL